MHVLHISSIPAAPRGGPATPARRRLSVEAPEHLLALQRSQFIVLDDAAPTRLSCLKGRLWVTQHGQAEDLVLEAGDSLWLRAPGRTLIEALCPASVSLSTRGVAT